MDKEREELVKQLKDFREKSRSISKRLDELDHKHRFDNAKKYEGRFFIEKDDRNSDSVRCLFVHDTDHESCKPMCILVSYWKDMQDQYFGIESYSYFSGDDDDTFKWIETTEEEFTKHYNEVQRRIELAVSRKK